MRLLRLAIANWRGVDAREFRFADGITLISGPNEVGKSTIVEALRMLFSELDSSRKKEVKAIQPRGSDVGSSVEVEVKAGEYHFIFAKTYNKSKQTTLNILAPEKAQLAGRDAHQQVQQILQETVDLALWEALLVDQGAKVGRVRLHDSAGLAKALDEAAGSGTASDEDADIYAAVEAEYEKFFTLRQHKPKFVAERDACESALAALEDAKEKLAAVQNDVLAHERATKEARRLSAFCADQERKIAGQEKAWQNLVGIRRELAEIKQQLEAAHERRLAAEQEWVRRRTFVADVEQRRLALANEAATQAPLDARAAELDEQIAAARATANELASARKLALARYDLALRDREHCRAVAEMQADKKRQAQLRGFDEEIVALRKAVAGNPVTDDVLDALRQAESDLSVAHGRRDTAATTLTVAAETDITLQIDDEEVSVEESATHTASVAAQSQLRIPGVATISIEPPQSTAELQSAYEDAARTYRRLAGQLEVDNASAAVARNQLRKEALSRIDEFSARRQEVLQGEQEQEIDARIATVAADSEAYLRQRAAEPALPADLAAATTTVAEATSALSETEREFQAASERRDKAEGRKSLIDEQRSKAKEDRARAEATVEERGRRLDDERSREADAALEERAAAAAATTARLEEEVATLSTRLAGHESKSVEEQLDNARAVYRRAQGDLRREEDEQNVRADRLERSRADGRFEDVERAERDVDIARTNLRSIEQRALAVQTLYTTLGQHRDTARQAYVRPLKEAIERLGAIVFGQDLEVGIDENWSLTTRTLAGTTLDFDDLSVGAREQLGILTRLAAAQIVARQGGVPLIIDDALGFSDAARQERMGEAIAAAGRSCQIIILTSVPERFAHVGNADEIRFD